MRKYSISSTIGAIIGFVSFLFLASLPAVVYGGYAGLLLAGGILGTPVPMNIISKILIVFGMVLALTAVGFLFTIAGAASGALFGYLFDVKQTIKEKDVLNEKN